MTRKQEFRNRQVKQVLRDTIMFLLEKQNFDNITVNEICMEAAMSRTTFYQHYQDKYDLLTDCVAHLAAPLPGQLEQDDLEGFFDTVLDNNKKCAKVLRRLYQYDGTREVQQRIDARLIANFLRYYRHQERLGARYDVPVEMLAELVSSGFNNVVKWWVRNQFQPSQEQMVRFLARNMREISKINQIEDDIPSIF